MCPGYICSPEILRTVESRIKQCKNNYSSSTAWPLKLWPTCCPETSTNNYSLRWVIQEVRPHLRSGGSLKCTIDKRVVSNYCFGLLQVSNIYTRTWRLMERSQLVDREVIHNQYTYYLLQGVVWSSLHVSAFLQLGHHQVISPLSRKP